MSKLGKAFAYLRKQGYMARANFSCCRSCAGAAMAKEWNELIEKGHDWTKFKGFVCYDKQQGENKRDGLDFALSYGQIRTDKYLIGQDAKIVGVAVAAALDKFGVRYYWDGNPDVTIRIRNNPTLWKAAKVGTADVMVGVIVLPDQDLGAVTLGKDKWDTGRVLIGALTSVAPLAYVAWETGEVGPLLDFIQENFPDEFKKAVFS